MKKKTDTAIDMALFRERLGIRYKQLNMTHESLAKVAGVSTSTVSKWLSPNSKQDDYTGAKKDYIPSLDTIYKVAQALEVSVDYFLNPDMDCLTVSKQMISDYIGLSDNALTTLNRYKDKPVYDFLDYMLSFQSDMFFELIYLLSGACGLDAEYKLYTALSPAQRNLFIDLFIYLDINEIEKHRRLHRLDIFDTTTDIINNIDPVHLLDFLNCETSESDEEKTYLHKLYSDLNEIYQKEKKRKKTNIRTDKE